MPGDKRPYNSPGTGRSFSLDGSIDRQKEKQLIGSLSDSYKFKEDGLIKKTMSINVNGVAQHLISYYNPREVIENRLRLPMSVPDLASLEISPELLVKQNFRVPPQMESTFDQPDCNLSSRQHAYRSMSAGSIRGQEMDQVNMYQNSTNPSTFQRLDIDRSHLNNMYAHNPSFSPTIPSTIATSPSTPMIPNRPYHHQRHYSTSSSTFARPQDTYQDRHHGSIGHIQQDASTNSSQDSLYNPPIDSTTTTTRNDSHERLATPNLVQLLNPIHPLHNNNVSVDYNSYYEKQENNVLQPIEYNYYEKQGQKPNNFSSIKPESSGLKQDPHHRDSIGVYIPYQAEHPLNNNSVENIMFQNTSFSQ